MGTATHDVPRPVTPPVLPARRHPVPERRPARRPAHGQPGRRHRRGVPRAPVPGGRAAAGGRRLVPDVHHRARRAGGPARARGGAQGQQRDRPAARPRSGAAERGGHRRRPLRPPRPRRVRQPRPGQHRQGAQRRGRQRLGRGDADPRSPQRLAAGAPGPDGRVHRVQRRGARPARLGVLREAADLPARHHAGDDQPRHGRPAPAEAADRLRLATAPRSSPRCSTRSTGTRGSTSRPRATATGPATSRSFYAAGRPVLHFFTDLHEDYHRTTDDWQKINVEGFGQVAALRHRRW